MLDTYDEIGMENEYSKCIKSFASVTAGGQIASNGSNNLLDTLMGETTGSGQTGNLSEEVILQLLQAFLDNRNFSDITGLTGGNSGWLDTEKMLSSANYYKNNQFDATMLKITEKNGQKVFSLSEEQWNLVQYMEQNVFIDDGE